MPYLTYRLRMELIHLWCAQLPVQGRLLRDDVWHLVVKGHHHAMTTVSNRATEEVDRECAQIPLIRR